MTLSSDIASIAADTVIVHAVAQGNSTTDVVTAGGTVPTLAKRLAAIGTGAVRGAWVTTTAYVLNDVISNGGLWYRCAVAHTSGTFATDLAAVKWVAHNTYTALLQVANNLSDVVAATARTNLDVPQTATVTAAVAAQYPIGSVTAFAGSTAPTGYLLCDGSAVSRTTYAALFALIASTFGPGDGSTTFNVPDFRGRISIGVGTGNQSGASGTGIISGGTPLTARARGAWGGEEAHALSTGELAAHTHAAARSDAGSLYGQGGQASTGHNGFTAVPEGVTGSAGSGTAHNTMPPFLAIPFIIRAL